MNMTIPATNITFAQMFTMIFSGTFGLMGLIFLIVGLAFSASINRKRSRCTAYTEGEVCAMQAQFGSSGLRAVYSFFIDGKPYQYISNYSGTNNLLVGQTVQVYYDLMKNYVGIILTKKYEEISEDSDNMFERGLYKSTFEYFQKHHNK